MLIDEADDLPALFLTANTVGVLLLRPKHRRGTGLDCEANLRLVPPAEFRASAPVIVGRFGYVIMQGAGGGFELDLY